MAYATTADVQARVAPRTIDANSKPNSTQVTAWITETEAILEGELGAAGYVVPITDATRGIPSCRHIVAAKVAAMVLQAKDAMEDVAQNEPLALALYNEWIAFLDLVRSNPERLATYLGQVLTETASASGSALQSYWTNNTQGESLANGDFDPTFTRDGKF